MGSYRSSRVLRRHFVLFYNVAEDFLAYMKNCLCFLDILTPETKTKADNVFILI